jgi:DNA invertase Pin-like site-specific DNA recombinase
MQKLLPKQHHGNGNNKTAKTATNTNEIKRFSLTKNEGLASISYMESVPKPDTISARIAPKVCFSYVRFSSRVQGKGDSERRQQEIAPRVAKDKGWTLRKDLNAFDLGLSAYHKQNLGEKGSIPSILEGVKSGKIPQGSVMIIEALDRLTRTDIDEAMPLLSELLRAGLEIYIDRTSRHLTRASLKDPVELTMALFELKGSYEYSNKLSKRVGDAWKQKKARAADGVKLTVMAPAWLDVDRENNKITLNDKAAIVQRIFNSYANGKGIRTIMAEMNREEVQPFGKGRQNRSGQWSNTHLRRILSFRGVLGEYQPCNSVDRKRVPCGEPIPDYYPAVVETSTFYKVQERLAKQTRTGGSKRNATNLFTGLIKCKCGAAMHVVHKPSQGGKYRYIALVCASALRGKGCTYARIQNSWVERAVLSTLWLKVLPAMAEMDTHQDELAKLQGDFKNTQVQIKKWMQVIEEAETPPASVGNKLNALETKAAALKRQIETLSATIQGNPLADWQPVAPTIENRLRLQAILANEIDSLTIDAENLRAILELKEVRGRKPRFELAWERTGANHAKKELANSAFLLNGNQEAYLDQVLVWQSDQNLTRPGKRVRIKVVDTDKPFLFGIELGPNQIGILAT